MKYGVGFETSELYAFDTAEEAMTKAKEMREVLSKDTIVKIIIFDEKKEEE